MARMAMIGYARVSTTHQNPEAQAARLRGHGCTRMFTDHGVTGRLASRPQWDACRAFLRDGDVLVVTKLDPDRPVGGQPGQRRRRAAQAQSGPGRAGPGNRPLHPGLLAAIAEFEHDLIAERTRQLYERGDMPARRIAGVVGISRASLCRALPPVWPRDLTRP